MSINRRQFIARSATLAAASVAARAGFSQPSHRRPQRVAVIGVGHYHAFSPPNYLSILQAQKTDIVGVHDPDAAIAAKYAAQVGSAHAAIIFWPSSKRRWPCSAAICKRCEIQSR